MKQLPTNQSEAIQTRRDAHSPQDIQNIQGAQGIQGIQGLRTDSASFYSNDAVLTSMQQYFESQFMIPSPHVPEARNAYSVQGMANNANGFLNFGPGNDMSLPGIFPNTFQATTAEALPVMASASSLSAFDQLSGELSQFSLPLQFPASFLDFSMSDNGLILQAQQSQYAFLQSTQEQQQETQFISLQQIQEPQQQLGSYQNFFAPLPQIQGPQQQQQPGLRLQEFQPLQYPPTNFLPIPIDFSAFFSPDISSLSSPNGTQSTFSDQILFGVAENDPYFSSAVTNELQSVPFGELNISGVPCNSGDIVQSITTPIVRTQAHHPQVPIDQTVISSSSMTNTPSSLGKQKCSPLSDDPDYAGRKVKKGASKLNAKKRVVQKKKKETVKPVKPDGPRLQLKCNYMNCGIICSSYPSLSRHAEGHKWRGSYSPVRCESCYSSLSNEFSVQRHILRSIDDSKCRKLSAYSIMKSATEVDYVVKFNPNMPHGKKTARYTPEAFRKLPVDT
ncbi:hypothetical protein BGZ58_010781 [Dissophora ornata]|nr:hypothetical protein BGZ58_010781 [Dissophora ornata]